MSRHQRSTQGPLTRVTKSIGSLIGLAGEAHAHNKEKKALQEEQSSLPATAATIDHASYDDQEPDEEDWALDAASTELSATINAPEYSAPSMVGLSTPAAPTKLLPLPYPVILPQRRPQTKARGFVNAYAPLLGSCKGIDEVTFLNFLATFYKETQASDYWQVLNVGAMVVGNVPSVLAMAVSMSVGATANAGIAIQGRYRTNAYLDKVNEELFHPVNVHAMIMTFKPGNGKQDVVKEINVNAHDTALAKDLEQQEKHSTLDKLKNSSGKTRSEWAIPEAAPLVYSKIDKAAATAVDQGSTSGHTNKEGKQPNVLKRSTAFVQDYLDRRSHAEYAALHGQDSKLAVSGASQENWATRFADPNHPANSGSIAALLTGGKIDPRARRRGQLAEFKAARKGETLSEQEKQNMAMRRGESGESRGPIRKGLKRVMAEDVLYLVIAEMPSKAQMAEMARDWEE